MDLKTLTTSIIAGLAGMTLTICATVLLITGTEVPSEFIPTGIAMFGIAVGASTKA